ncbi:MAG: CbrC family protein [Lachnospiraceae bacterium]|nr:CbrC family protein [Lachnospiraceae bacterium]
MDPREIEPIYNYYFITDAEDDGLTLQIPGYFKGEALIGELHYNGGEHGIFVRNKHQLLLCDYINEGVRALLNNTCDIFVSETDSKREYMGRIVHDDIDAMAEEALKFHDFRFLYHPFPQSDGVLNLGDARCELCERKKGIYYLDPVMGFSFFHPERYRAICPKCIEENKAGDLFGNLGREYRSINGDSRVYRGNLPFLDRGQPAGFWAIHCNELAIYLGQLEPEDLIPRLREELISTWGGLLDPYAEMDPEETLFRFEKGELNAFIFRCANCGRVLCRFSENIP